MILQGSLCETLITNCILFRQTTTLKSKSVVSAGDALKEAQRARAYKEENRLKVRNKQELIVPFYSHMCYKMYYYSFFIIFAVVANSGVS